MKGSVVSSVVWVATVLLLLTGAIAVVATVGVPPKAAAGVGAGLVGLVWLVVLLTVPWGLYFRAHAVLGEIRVSRDKGLTVHPAREEETRRIARTMFWIAVAGHVLSAGIAAAVARFTGGALGYWLAGFFLLSTVFRPAGAWFGQVRRRLGTLLKDVKYPRDDVFDVLTKVTGLERQTKLLAEKTEEHYRALAETRRALEALGASQQSQRQDTERRFEAMGREFESAINRLTDNEEIITGIKAFLRLLRAGEGVG